jgi:hypothetical protein
MSEILRNPDSRRNAPLTPHLLGHPAGIGCTWVDCIDRNARRRAKACGVLERRRQPSLASGWQESSGPAKTFARQRLTSYDFIASAPAINPDLHPDSIPSGASDKTSGVTSPERIPAGRHTFRQRRIPVGRKRQANFQSEVKRANRKWP